MHNNKNKNQSFLITRPEIKFWMAIISIIVGGVIAFTNLKNEVSAMYGEGVQLRREYEDTDDLLKELNDRTIRMEGNQKHIMRELGIEVD